MSRSNRVRLTAAYSILAVAGLAGCQSGATRSDAFEAASNRPPTPRTLHMMARMLQENGRHDQAEYVLLKVVDENPRYLPAYVELADLQVTLERYHAAVGTLRAAHEVAANDAVIANNLGVLLLRQNDPAAATEAFRAAVRTDPGEARYRANHALGLGLQGRDDECYRMYASILPPEEAYWNLGVIAEARRDDEVANAYFAKASRIREDADWPDEAGFEPAVTASVPVN